MFYVKKSKEDKLNSLFLANYKNRQNRFMNFQYLKRTSHFYA